MVHRTLIVPLVVGALLGAACVGDQAPPPPPAPTTHSTMHPIPSRVRDSFGSMGQFILNARAAKPWGNWYRADVSLIQSIGPQVGRGQVGAGQGAIHLIDGSGFLPSDVGKLFYVKGAGPDGSDLSGIMTTYLDSQDATLSTTAHSSVSAGAVFRVQPTYRTTFPIQTPSQPDIAGMAAAGIRFVPVVRHNDGDDGVVGKGEVPIPPGGGPAFQRAVEALLRAWSPYVAAAVFGNEVNAPSQWPGTHPQYRNLLTFAARACTAVKIPCGGAALTTNVTEQAVYRWAADTLGPSQAERFRMQMNGFEVDPARATVADAFIDDVKAAGLDAIVWHFYQDGARAGEDATPYLALPMFEQFFRARFGVNWANEVGNRTYKIAHDVDQASTDLRHLIRAFASIHTPMVLLYGSGLGPNQPDQLWNADGSPTPEGSQAIEEIRALAAG